MSVGRLQAREHLHIKWPLPSTIALVVLKVVVATALFVVLFAAGSAVVPSELAARQASAGAQRAAAQALLAVGALDVAVLVAIGASSRLRGWRLWALLSGFTWFVMSVTSQLEAIYFMPNVTAGMLPWLLGMTLPVAILFPPVLMTLFGLWRADPSLLPAWRPPALPRLVTARRVGVLAGVVYPLVFFAAGYFIAWQSPAVRQFYTGSTELPGVLAHLRHTFSTEPSIYPFELFRGLLWIGAALLILRTTRGPWWWGTLLVALAFCFIQNDLHLLSNPLMPAEVSRVHFLETGSSNIVWAWAIGWMLQRPPARPGGTELAMTNERR
jgi:hypothetical protein